MIDVLPEEITLSDGEIVAMEKEICERHLVDFVEAAWHVIEPGAPFIRGWHIDAICEHLEAVTNGQITRLHINVPPGMMKSLLVGVFWPMWEWGPKRLQWTRYLCASHSQDFATRDNLRARRLCFSRWFQRRWPTPLASDQDTKKKFENQATGWRQAMAMSGMVGERGDRVILDDPHTIEGAISDAERTTTIRIFQETVQTRLNNPEKSAVVVIMQRIHQQDISGHIIDEHLGWDHLMLPMKFEPDRKCKTSIGFEDPRTEEDELLFPERFPAEVVERDEKAMGGSESAAVAGQHQQKPVPRGGLLLKVEKIKFGIPPKEFTRVWRYWDKAGTQDGGKRTAGVKIGLTPTGEFWMLDVVKGQWSAANREAIIKQTSQLDGRLVRVGVEQEPGSGGLESAESTVKSLAGYRVEIDRVTGDKALRAEPLACQIEGGNFYMPDPEKMPEHSEWVKAWINEARFFPLGKFKDQVDAASGAFNNLATVQSSLMAMTRR